MWFTTDILQTECDLQQHIYSKECDQNAECDLQHRSTKVCELYSECDLQRRSTKTCDLNAECHLQIY